MVSTQNYPLNGNFRGKNNNKKYGYSDLKWICSHQDSWIFSQKCLSSTTLAQYLPHLSTLHPLHRNLVKSTVFGICLVQTQARLLSSAIYWCVASLYGSRTETTCAGAVQHLCCVPKDKDLTSDMDLGEYSLGISIPTFLKRQPF